MTPRSTDPWLDAVQGRDHVTDSAAAREGAAVRDYYRQRKVEETDHPLDSQRELRMLNYLRAKGAFAEPEVRPTPWQRAWRWLAGGNQRTGHWAWLAGVAATVLVVPIVLQLAQTPNVEDLPISQYRGPQAQTSIKTPDPAASAQAIAAVLSDQHIPYRQVQTARGWRIEAKVPADARALLQPRLETWRIVMPANGILIIDIEGP
jgi:hypothetical protein